MSQLVLRLIPRAFCQHIYRVTLSIKGWTNDEKSPNVLASVWELNLRPMIFNPLH
uniref:Uncharacterized protein n=1 Tax=Solanum tuberosum TaxID=4113 RepID=M1C2B8_SOLTU